MQTVRFISPVAGSRAIEAPQKSHKCVTLISVSKGVQTQNSSVTQTKVAGLGVRTAYLEAERREHVEAVAGNFSALNHGGPRAEEPFEAGPAEGDQPPDPQPLHL